ncbi:MAG: ribonuclease P protein component [Ferruginibacter sp.]
MKAETTTRYFLKKDNRLKSRKAIEILFAKGRHFSEYPLRVFWLFSEREGGLKAGFTASSKNFKKATDRNRIKRVVKEAYRLQKNNLEADKVLVGKSLHLFFIYTGKELPAYELIFEKTGNVMKRISNLINENTVQGP